MSFRATAIASATVLSVSACVGTIEDAPIAYVPPPEMMVMEEPEPEPEPEPEEIPEVPLTIAVAASTSTCTTLLPGEELLAVSAEGHLWLATSSAATTIRVLDGWDASYAASFELPFTSIASAQAWTATTASMIADGRLWHIEDGERLS